LIKVYVQFMVYLPSLPELTLGKKIIPVEIKEGATLGELLEELVNIYGPPLAQAIYDPRRKALQDLVMVTINGQLSHTLNALDTILQQGDRIVFVPLVMGG